MDPTDFEGGPFAVIGKQYDFSHNKSKNRLPVLPSLTLFSDIHKTSLNWMICFGRLPIIMIRRKSGTLSVSAAVLYYNYAHGVWDVLLTSKKRVYWLTCAANITPNTS